MGVIGCTCLLCFVDGPICALGEARRSNSSLSDRADRKRQILHRQASLFDDAQCRHLLQQERSVQRRQSCRHARASFPHRQLITHTHTHTTILYIYRHRCASVISCADDVCICEYVCVYLFVCPPSKTWWWLGVAVASFVAWCITVPNFIKINQMVAEIVQFFQVGSRPPFCICGALFGTIH